MAQGFHIVDYVIFAATLIVSLGIGIYYALHDGGQKTTGEYLMGNRNLKILPVALSMLVSFVSAVGILGTPAEMYAYGTQYSMYIIAAGLGCVYGAYLFVPLLYPLKLTSSFEYFELRFESRVPRVLGCLIMLLNSTFMNGTTLFAPSLALEAVTGFPVWISIILCGLTATIYTTVGGMKAVIWTDVFQSVVIFLGMLAVVIIGVIKVGGFGEVWRLNDEWGRIEFFNMDPDPRVRCTFWSVCVMMSILWMCFTTAQAAVQRYCALPTMKAARMSVLLNIPGFVIIGLLTVIAGVVVFAYYAKIGCDPVSAGKISNPNQILPYFVMDVMGYPGLPGIFVACLYSGSLSTLSSSLNAMSAVTWEDLLKLRYKSHLSEQAQANVAKILVFVYGVLSIAMGFVITQMGGTFIQIVFSVMGTTGGPIVGMFFLGATYPRAGPWGALLGGLFGLVMSIWVAVGAFVSKIHTMPRPLPRENCPMPNMTLAMLGADAGSHAGSAAAGMTGMEGNLTMMAAMGLTGNSTQPAAGGAMDAMMMMMNTPRELHGVENVYAISYLWYPTIGIVCVMLVGILTSWIPGLRQRNYVDKKYIFPILRGFSEFCQRGMERYEEQEEFNEVKKPLDPSQVIYPEKKQGTHHPVKNGFSPIYQDSLEVLLGNAKPLVTAERETNI